MDVGAISNNAIDIQTLINGSSGINRSNNVPSQTANYAQKGEPMYMADMDSDEDGTVTLDEFRDYCKSKNINTREMVKMSKMAASYRTMEAENQTIDYISKLIPNIHPNVKQANSDSNHVKSDENKYNISPNVHGEQKVSYKEYMAYCEQNAKTDEVKTDTKVQEDDSGVHKITNAGKAIFAYKNNNAHTVKSTFEEAV